ncbi:hypothetical protein GUG51_14715, partial [Xanthomonas citri pv. citri]|nr:hypothetical protein [Xanthomonas citri pv. citri]
KVGINLGQFSQQPQNVRQRNIVTAQIRRNPKPRKAGINQPAQLRIGPRFSDLTLARIRSNPVKDWPESVSDFLVSRCCSGHC